MGGNTFNLLITALRKSYATLLDKLAQTLAAQGVPAPTSASCTVTGSFIRRTPTLWSHCLHNCQAWHFYLPGAHRTHLSYRPAKGLLKPPLRKIATVKLRASEFEKRLDSLQLS